MSLGFRKFISEMFMNGKFPKILPSENFPLYGIYIYVCIYIYIYIYMWLSDCRTFAAIIKTH